MKFVKTFAFYAVIAVGFTLAAKAYVNAFPNHIGPFVCEGVKR